MTFKLPLTKVLWILSSVSGCTAPPHMWTVDSIAAGNRIFDVSRLRYCPPQSHSPLAFEMVKVGEQIEAFLTLTRFRLPATETAKVLFTIAGHSFEEYIPIHEGGMRLCLSSETTQQLIQALREGHKIGIFLDDFEEILDPSQFSSSFAQFKGLIP